MKKLILLKVAIACVFSFAVFLNTVSAQSVQMSKPIPDNIVAIAKKSCVNCHTEPGNKMALSKVNISKWASYTAVQEAAKSADMCKMVTEGKMPPKSFKDKNPGFVVSKDEITMICDWSASLKVAKK